MTKPRRHFSPQEKIAIRVQTPLPLEDARRIVAHFVEHYNTVRLHSALGYVTAKDKFEGSG